MKTVRLIITLDCPRDCSYCCNKQPVLKQAKKIQSPDCLLGYDEICITGGEPMLYPNKIIDIIESLNNLHPLNRKIYLYTAMFNEDLIGLIPKVDGIHVTLHQGMSGFEMGNFYHFQERSSSIGFWGGSYRLYIHPDIKDEISIYPNRWSRIESKPFLEDCPLPENETYLYWKN